MKEQAIERRGPWMAEVVEGEPIRVGGRQLVPLVRVRGRVHRRALVGSDRLGGRGWGFVHMKPVAIVERDDVGERRVPIQDRTIQALGRLLLVALVIPFVAVLIVRLARGTSR